MLPGLWVKKFHLRPARARHTILVSHRVVQWQDVYHDGIPNAILASFNRSRAKSSCSLGTA